MNLKELLNYVTNILKDKDIDPEQQDQFKVIRLQLEANIYVLEQMTK